MFKTLACIIIVLTSYLRSGAQTGVADSLRALVQKINNATGDCKKINDYKANISKIDPASLRDALGKFIYADSVFLKENKSSNCTISKAIENADSLLKIVRNTASSDSLKILKAILFVKFHIKDSGFVSVTLTVRDDKNVNIKNPLITLNSFEPFLVTPASPEDTSYEIYIRRGSGYLLRVADSGYTVYQHQFSAQKDSAFPVRLNYITAVPGVIIPPVEPVSQSYWWIPGVLLILALFALAWKFLSGKKRNSLHEAPVKYKEPVKEDYTDDQGRLKESIARLNEKVKEKDDLINKDAGEIQALKVQLAALSKGQMTGNNTVRNNPGKYFLSEMMVTAGPRKPTDQSNSDGDLGEDVCGFVMAGDEVFFWLLDGSSNYSCLRDPASKREYFSSRLLAQSIARKLRSHFAERKMEAFEKTMITIVNEVKSDWLKTINTLPESEKTILKDNIKQGFRAECASAVIIGTLSLGGELNVYRVGDSKMFAYSSSGDQKVFVNTPLSVGKDKNYDYLFLTMGLTNDEFDIKGPEPKFEIVKEENIQTIIAFSDGIGKVTEEELKKVYPVNAEAARAEIIYQLQGTGDDKSLCIIEIKE